MQTNFCKNCEHVFQGHFCSNCGQKTNTKRLDFHYLYDELKYTFLHINSGLLYTAKQLLIRPGDMIREFVEGKRVKHYKPVLMVFVLGGVYGLLMHYSGDLEFMKKISPKNVSSTVTLETISNFVSKYFTLIQLISILPVSLCTWLAFKKWGYNFIENVIINSYTVAQSLLIGIVLFPIKYFCTETVSYVVMNTIGSLLSYGYIIWTYIVLYKNYDLGQRILRILLAIFYFMLLFLVVCILTGAFAFFYTLYFGNFS